MAGLADGRQGVSHPGSLPRCRHRVRRNNARRRGLPAAAAELRVAATRQHSVRRDAELHHAAAGRHQRHRAGRALRPVGTARLRRRGEQPLHRLAHAGRRPAPLRSAVHRRWPAHSDRRGAMPGEGCQRPEARRPPHHGGGPIVGQASAERVLGKDWDGVSTPVSKSSTFWIAARLGPVEPGEHAVHAGPVPQHDGLLPGHVDHGRCGTRQLAAVDDHGRPAG